MRCSPNVFSSMARSSRPPTLAVLRSARCLNTKPEGDVSKATEVTTEVLTNSRGEVVKTWGSGVDLPAVTKEEAEEKFLDTTSVARALTPPVATAVAARDDMLKDRFNYVSNNLNSSSQYIVMGSKGAVAPAAIGQGSFIIAGICVLLGAIGSVVYVRTQWGVKSPKELGDRLREKGAERKERMESSGGANLVRTLSSQAEKSVKENVELVRRPSQDLGSHLNTSFKGVVKENR